MIGSHLYNSLMEVLPLIKDRVEQGHGSFLEVASSGYIQTATHKASMARQNAEYEAYLAALVAAQKNSSN